MRIGLVSSCYAPVPGGTQTYVKQLAIAMGRAGHAVVVATRRRRTTPDGMGDLQCRSEPPVAVQEDGVQVVTVAPASPARPLLRLAHRLHHYRATQAVAAAAYAVALATPLTRALRGCDVIHYSGTGRELFGFAARVAADRLGVPLLVTPHLHAGSWGDSDLDLRLYRRAARVVALTEAERARLVQLGLPRDAIAKIGNIIEVRGDGQGERFRRRQHIPPDVPVVLFLGRREEAKGYGLLLSALPTIWASHPRAHVALIGAAGGDEPEVARRHAATLADPRVRVLDHVDELTKEDALAACDVFCLPSTAEAFGIALMEAGAYGKPVVARRQATLEELSGGSALLVSPTPHHVAEAVAELIADRALRTALGEAGQKNARRHDWRCVSVQMAALYGEAISCTSPRGELPRVNEVFDRISCP